MTPLNQLLDRIQDYDWRVVAVELAVLWLLVYAAFRFVRGTRAAGALKGLLVVLIVGTVGIRLVGQQDLLARLGVLWDSFLGVSAIALIVIFQPELRRALIRLGEAPLLRQQQQQQVTAVVESIVDAAEFLSKNRFGAIIAVERKVGLRDLATHGRPLNADVSADLLRTIFWPNSPLHDMGVVISGGRMIAASVPFPLADEGEMVEGRLGTRHRAAVGLTKATDAVCVVVSEETGGISIALDGKLNRWLTLDRLRAQLRDRLTAPDDEPDDSASAAAASPARRKKRTRVQPEAPSGATKATERSNV
ncbi:MAG: diadenylate cyclase CdaA [Planctomycetota bacterium]